MMLSSPYATDPAYGGSKDPCYVDIDSSPKPRVRPEADEIYHKSQGVMGRLLQVQAEPVYRPPSRQKPEPKDFGCDNVRKMRQIQSANRRKKREDEKETKKPVKVLPQSVKYKEVSSKVAEHVKQPPPEPRPSSANYLRSHSRTGGTPTVRGRSPSPAPRPQTAPEVKDTDANFIAHNARLARNHKPPRPPSAMASETIKIKQIKAMREYQKGEVPKYLKGRQKQWAKEEDERIRRIPDPDMPPGHKMMPKEERLKTLQVLKEKEKHLQQELHKLPLKAETYRAKTKEAEVNLQLAEVEEAIKIFSRSKVFIKIDS